jgi:LysM repeat protein
LAERKDRIYVVKKGDSLTGIAERFNVPLPALLIWNRLNLKSTIHPGDELIIHKAEVETIDIDNEENNREARPSGND